MFKWFARLIALGVVASAAGYAALASRSTEGLGGIQTGLNGDATRGAYVARMAGCIGCHSDFENGGAPLAGGPALKTPFGIFRAPNITPDKEHGIGAWSLDDFAVALRHGTSPDGEPYYPAFPYPFYTRLTDQDIVDLWTAIWTVPPVAEPWPDHDLDFPFSIRGGLKVWRALYFEPGRFEPDSSRGQEWNRGAYIVEGPGHCGACHTPRNLFGARDAERALHGASGLPDGGKSPPITEPALRGNGWTQKDIVWALRTGLLPDGDSFGGSMGEVVRDGTQYLSDADLQAIARYLLPESPMATADN